MASTRYSNTYSPQRTLNKTTNLDKLNRLSDKLNVINNTIEQEKGSKFEFLHEKISEVEEKMADVNEGNQKKFGIVKENLNKIQKQIEEERLKSESLMEAKNHYVKVLEGKINDRFNQEADIRKEIERRFVSIIDDKFNSLKIEISKESRNRYESIENLKTYLENDVPKLQGLVKFEQGEREMNDENLLKKVSEEVSKLMCVVQSEKKTREETEEAVLEMLRIMITKMKGDIENERKDRELTEETLLSLLEDTCNKLNTASQV